MSIRLAIYSVNPVQYHAPIFKELDKVSTIDTTIFFGSNIGAVDFYSKELQTTISWDIPILDGYKYQFFYNLAFQNSRGSFSRINFGMVKELVFGKYDVALIHGYDTVSSWLVFLTCKLTRKKILWRGEASLRPQRKGSIVKKILKSIILPWYFRRCDAVLYSCTGNLEYLKDFCNDRRKMFLIPCAVDNEFFRSRILSSVKKKQLRTELGIGQDEFVVIFCARMTKRKRPTDLVLAVSKMENKNIVLLYLGSGPELVEVKRLAVLHEIKVVTLGFVGQNDLATYYSIGNLYTILSEYDASPKSLNEALNFSLPVIATNKVGTAFDLVKHGENGYIIDSGDCIALASSIETIYLDKVKAKGMGKVSLSISDNWTIKKDVEAIEKAINHAFK